MPTTTCTDSDLHTQVAQFLFGDGFAISGGDAWRVRRRDVQPALHRTYLDTMIRQVFFPSAQHLSEKLQVQPILSCPVLSRLPALYAHT